MAELNPSYNLKQMKGILNLSNKTEWKQDSVTFNMLYAKAKEIKIKDYKHITSVQSW